MLSLPTPPKPAPRLRARGMGLRLRIGPNAFGNALGSSLAGMAAQSGGQDSGGTPMSRRQAERAEYGVSLKEVLGGEKNYLGMLGGYNGGSLSGQAGGSWDSTVAAWRADNPTYQVLPQVEISGRRETAEYQLNVAFGLDKKVTFSDANPSRIEAQQSIWSSYANIAGAYRSGQIGLGDAAAMAWDNTKFAYQGSQRAQGAVQMFNGGLEVAGGLALSATGVGAVVGIPLAFHGGDNFGTGLVRRWTDQPQNTVTYNGVEALTGSRNAAEFVDQAIPFAGAVAGTAQAINVLTANSLTVVDRQQLARNFYMDQGWSPARIESHLSGINFNQPVIIDTLVPGKAVGQWQVLGNNVGNYFSPLGTEASQLGINPAGRTLVTYMPSESVQVLRSTAAPIIDTWTVPGVPYSAQGGGTQFFTGQPSLFVPFKP